MNAFFFYRRKEIMNNKKKNQKKNPEVSNFINCVKQKKKMYFIDKKVH